MKKTALALPLIFAALIPSVANAEFMRSYSSSDPNVNYTHFFLRVYSPDNNQTCKSTLLLNFSVEWTDYPRFAGFPSPPAPVMKGLYSYTIDNNPAVTVTSNQSSTDQFERPGFKINPTFSYLLDVSNLTNGYHKIAIKVGLTITQSYVARYINTETPIQFFVQNPTPTDSPNPIPTSEVLPTSADWNEVTRFSGSGSEKYTSDYFTCDYEEWRIRWAYVPTTQQPDFAFFSVFTYPESEGDRGATYVNEIMKTGTADTNGTSFIHNYQGTFHMYIDVEETESYTIIVEQNLNSIPEFPSGTILPLFLIATFVGIIVRKKQSSSERF